MNTIMDAARERAEELDQAWRKARTDALNAWADLAALDLIRLAEENPLIGGLTFETSYEYDDEGGYFRTINTYPLTSGPTDEDPDPDWDFHDTFSTYGPEVVCILAGLDEDAESGSVMLDQARLRVSP